VARLDTHFGVLVRVVVTVVVTTVPGAVVPSVVAAFTGFGPRSGGIAGDPAELVAVAVVLEPMSGVTGVGAGAPAFGWFTGVTTPAVAASVVVFAEEGAALTGAAATVVAAGVLAAVAAALVALAVSASLARRRNCMLIHASAVAGTFTL
jgi:hypothetical protein